MMLRSVNERKIIRNEPAELAITTSMKSTVCAMCGAVAFAGAGLVARKNFALRRLAHEILDATTSQLPKQ